MVHVDDGHMGIKKEEYWLHNNIDDGGMIETLQRPQAVDATLLTLPGPLSQDA